MLLLTSATGLALLVLCETLALGLALAMHPGVVFSPFITMSYGKFMRGIYRFLALVRYAKEKLALKKVPAEPAKPRPGHPASCPRADGALTPNAPLTSASWSCNSSISFARGQAGA